ncbi:carboxypeptidase regulatory-like domain-containing protein [Pseudenhygromyxa sp. WMMC2535]|uniref:carboxypeptidase-like regulatory domain-containing protein n=1 Tax=Pseudenhygromyxa sp. WMMC2535 TaxID=2712867 RepID=UPI001551E02B|nr:carboxypeptidase-like regulatory domain-containing protein [Pseudenhygromyxa sp. WMMC2535]NVB39010.1 carboxypeptidase regulatory-like domain-containing protein [Pseudenhygromyxa sp. WMMC2535]
MAETLRARPGLRCLAGLIALSGLGCVGAGPTFAPVARDTIVILSPRCAGVSSCVLGHVTSAEGGAPVAQASVFLEREGEQDGAGGIRIMTLTDEQGVFTVADPPPGSYRVAIYKQAGSVEVVGIELGRAGTTVLPIRLAVE